MSSKKSIQPQQQSPKPQSAKSTIRSKHKKGIKQCPLHHIMARSFIFKLKIKGKQKKTTQTMSTVMDRMKGESDLGELGKAKTRGRHFQRRREDGAKGHRMLNTRSFIWRGRHSQRPRFCNITTKMPQPMEPWFELYIYEYI